MARFHDSADDCSACQAGTYNDATGAGSCSACAAGTIASTTGLTSCSDCVAGKHQSTTSQASCIDCEAGSVASGTGALSCTACDAGRKASGTNSTSCDDCAPGRYASGTHAKVCADCERGSYSTSSGATSCAICVSPTTTAGAGAENCSACVKDYYWDPRITKDKRDKELELKGLGGCTKCPDGVDCGSSIHTNHTLDALHVKKNWYRASSTATKVYKCAGENCQGGKSAVGDKSCAENAKGPLCALCKPKHFLAPSIGKCKECSDSHIFASFAVLLSIVGFVGVIAVAWHFGKNVGLLKQVRERAKTWILEHKTRFQWFGIVLRILFYNSQIIAKYTELQDVQWPIPFKGYVEILSGIALDINQVVPSLKCSPSFDAYSMLFLWTLSPFALYAAALLLIAVNQHSDAAELYKQVERATGNAFAALPLIHTLVTVKLFQIFDCDEFDMGDETGPNIDEEKKVIRYLSTDYSIKCDSTLHRNYQLYAIFMIIIYCALLPAVMTRFKWHQHRKSGASLGYYKPSFWWFDTFDLFYRLSMTGLLLAIFQRNSEKRMFVSILISTACLSFVYSFRPFLNESHNAILATGQTVVSITIACGYVVTFGEIKGSEVGWLLLSINILLVVFSITQQWFEELHLLLDAILAQGSFDADTVTRLCCGSSVGVISGALLKSACACLDNVIGGNDERADRYFHYLTKDLLSLKNSDGCLLWDSKIPLGVHWAPHVQHYVNSAVGEFFSSEEAASARDLEGCVTAVRGIFGTLINEADARATFQNLRKAETDHHSRLSAQDPYSARIQRPRSRSAFAAENSFVEMVDGVSCAYEQEEESTRLGSHSLGDHGFA